jgi:hypothetical protein
VFATRERRAFRLSGGLVVFSNFPPEAHLFVLSVPAECTVVLLCSIMYDAYLYVANKTATDGTVLVAE